jgi:hypothetical protein
MPRNMIQDVVPPGKRSIRNITLVKPRRNGAVPPPMPPQPPRPPRPMPEDGGQDDNHENLPWEPSRKKRSPRGLVFLAAAILVAGGFLFFLLNSFASAQVSITPKRQNVELNLSLNVSQSGANGSLRYEIIETKKEAGEEVKASGEEMAEVKAAGKITIYNNFSPDEQRLIARTRFQTADGLIFRISESVVVPGMKTVNGKSEPGTLVASVFADDIKASEFTIPGFKDDAKRYSGFYAKSNSDMTGGFIGKVKKVSEADKAAAIENMKKTLIDDLEKEIGSKLPETLVALPGAVTYEFRELPIEPKEDKALLKLQGIAKIMVVEKKALSEVVAKEYLTSWENIPAEIESFDNISLTFDKGFDATVPQLKVSVKGSAPVVATVDESRIAEGLAGKPKSDLKVIMADYPSVLSARVSLKPLWKNSFPEDPTKIHVSIESSE